MAINKNFTKKKKKNLAGRKDPRFAKIVIEMVRDCTASPLELTGKKEGEWDEDEAARVIITKDKVPENITVVETLNGHWAFHNDRMLNHIEMMARVMREFPDEFWSENGASICDLRRDRKNRCWGDDQTILQFCYLALGMNLARYSYTRDKWKELQSGMPYLVFDCPKRGHKLNESDTRENNKTEREENGPNGIR